MVNSEQICSKGRRTSGDNPNVSPSDTPLLDLLDAPVNDGGGVTATEDLGMNYRTLVTCYDSQRVSRRMRRALEEYRDADVDGDEQRDDAADMSEVAAKENRALREAVEAQAEQSRLVVHRRNILSSAPDTEPPTVFPAHDGGSDTWRPGRLAGVCRLSTASKQASGRGGPRWSARSGEWAGSGHSSQKGRSKSGWPQTHRSHVGASYRQGTPVPCRGRPEPPPSQD